MACPPPPRGREDAELLAQREALTKQLMARHPGVAISIWSPLEDPSNPYSLRLLGHNEAFLRICDAVSFGNGALENVVPMNAVFRSQALAVEVSASLRQSFEIFNFIQAGKSTFAASKLYHISKVGILKRVYAEWYLLTCNGIGRQVLFAEFPLADDKWQEDPQPPFITPAPEPVPAVSDPEPHPPEGARQTSPQNLRTVFDAGNKARRWTTWGTQGSSSSPPRTDKPAVSRKRGSTPTLEFKCAGCGAAETIQKRCAFSLVPIRPVSWPDSLFPALPVP